MKKTLGKLILYVILWIVAGAALSVVATRIGSDYLHSLAVIGPPMVVGYLSSLEDGKEEGPPVAVVAIGTTDRHSHHCVLAA